MAGRAAGRFGRRAFFNGATPTFRPAAPRPQAFEFPSSRRARVLRPPSAGLRREVVTMLPMHSATANAWLVSRISDILVDAGVYRVLTINTCVSNASPFNNLAGLPVNELDELHHSSGCCEQFFVLNFPLTLQTECCSAFKSHGPLLRRSTNITNYDTSPSSVFHGVRVPYTVYCPLDLLSSGCAR